MKKFFLGGWIASIVCSAMLVGCSVPSARAKEVMAPESLESVAGIRMPGVTRAS
jgi:hypothetical protein